MTQHYNRHGALPAVPAISTRDLRDALPAVFQFRAGLTGKPDDPIAQDLIEANMSLMRTAQMYAGGDRADPSLLSRAIGTTAFGTDLVGGLAGSAFASFDVAAAGIMKALRQVLMRDFKLANIPALSISGLESMPEGSAWPHSDIAASTVLEAVQLSTFGLRARISRQAILNDEQYQLASLFAALGQTGALNIDALLAAALEDTGPLADGTPFFDATHGNLLTSGAPSVASFDAVAAAMFRQAKPAGGIAGLAPKILVVPPALYGVSCVLASALFGQPAGSIDRPLEVVVCSHLSSPSTWYALASPVSAPTVAILGFGTTSMSRPLLIEKNEMPIAGDGVAFSVRQDVRIARVSRLGAIKVTT